MGKLGACEAVVEALKKCGAVNKDAACLGCAAGWTRATNDPASNNKRQELGAWSAAGACLDRRQLAQGAL